MLTAAQIDGLRTASEQLLDPVVEFLIEDIARRVSEAGQLTGTAAYQVWRAQELGISQKQLKNELQKRLNVSATELEKLMKQAAKTGYNFDISRLPSQGIPYAANSSIQQIVAAAVAQAKADLTNITKTMGFVGSDGKARELTEAYRKACDDAFMRTVTGAQDYNSAIRDALKGLSDKGIVSVDYHSGRHFTIEAAVRQNIMGGMGIMQEHISEQNHDDLGCDGWELSAHANSAPDHEPIQGRQYTDKQYKALNSSLLRPIGTLNCGHAAFPIIIGVHSPQYTEEELEELRQQNETGVTIDGRHYTGYEATQRQRELERAIRKKKRHILIDKTVGDEEKLQADQIKLVRLRDEYARFSKAAGLPTQYARTEAAGFTWKEGKEAIAAAKQADIKIDPNEEQTRKQYERYKERIASRMSGMEYGDFFELKKSGSEEWDRLQHDYRYTGIVNRLIKNNQDVVVCTTPEDIPDSYHDAAKGLTESQKNGLYHYSHHDEGVKMNRSLGHVSGVTLTPEEQSNLNQTADALNHMTLPENTILWRGTEPHILKGFENLDPKDLNSWKLKEVSMDGFTSTSILQTTSYNDKPVQMVILAPKNMFGAGYINDVSYNLAHLGEVENGHKLSQEYEILLQKGSRFSIIEAQKFIDKTILVVKWEGGIS